MNTARAASYASIFPNYLPLRLSSQRDLLLYRAGAERDRPAAKPGIERLGLYRDREMPVHAVVDQVCRSEKVSPYKGDDIHLVAVEVHSHQPLRNIEVSEAGYLKSPEKHGNDHTRPSDNAGLKNVCVLSCGRRIKNGSWPNLHRRNRLQNAPINLVTAGLAITQRVERPQPAQQITHNCPFSARPSESYVIAPLAQAFSSCTSGFPGA